MAIISRNDFSFKIQRKYYGTSYASTIIFNAVKDEIIGFETFTLQEGQRLDQISGGIYGTSDYWWVIAAASGIGWGLQVPPGTIINVPNSLEEVLSLLWQKDLQTLVELKDQTF